MSTASPANTCWSLSRRTKRVKASPCRSFVKHFTPVSDALRCLGYGVIHYIVARLMKGRYHGALVIMMTVVIGVRVMTANTTKT